MISDLLIDASGDVRCIYGESIDFATLGRITIRRASHVEPTAEGRWTANLSPVNGPELGPFGSRSAAVAAELAWLQRHWLCGHPAACS